MARPMEVLAAEKERKPLSLKSSFSVRNTRSTIAFSFGSPLSAILMDTLSFLSRLTYFHEQYCTPRSERVAGAMMNERL
ncbi:hypothetical protein LZD49_32660 [Dyadobacter sp. CY261]|uniref:hypothetical protein n=1 Tax=Dyadobacter sp. CY261 TaxID=2907203 RepID=UPI001F3C3983|nr:hypothetical protein [Dyadobacter sp. CY261]MCF0075278.1 hypothetical protein [Dyadobacter sp. CY261]